MADPFSITAGIAGIAAPALHGTRILLDDLRKISDAPALVKALEGDISTINLTLESLREIPEAQWEALGNATVEQSKTTIRTCTEACVKFKADLEQWKGKSKGGQLSFRGRLNVGFLRESQIKSMSGQLQKYQGTLSMVISMANLSVVSPMYAFLVICVIFANHLIRRASISEKPIPRDKKDAFLVEGRTITNIIAATDQELATMETQLRNLSIDGNSANSANFESDESTRNVRVIEDEMTAFQQSLRLLEELRVRNEIDARKIAQEEQRGRTHVTFGSENHGLQLYSNTGSMSGFTFGSQKA